MTKKVQQSRDFAIENHADQKYGEHQYVYHLDQVHDLLKSFHFSEKYLIASYLHDLLEDKPEVSHDYIINEYGQDIFMLVFSVSGFGENRKEKQNNIITKLLSYHDAIDLKMGDRIINIKNALIDKDKNKIKMYLKEKDLYNQVFLLGNSSLYCELNKLYIEAENLNIQISNKKFFK